MSKEAKKRVLRDQALRLDKSSLTIADECLRFRFEESADLVSLMASHGELDYSEVLEMVRGVLAGDTDAEEAAAALDAYGLSSLMRTVAGQHASGALMPGDFAEAADITRGGESAAGRRELQRHRRADRGSGQPRLQHFDHVRADAGRRPPQRRHGLATQHRTGTSRERGPAGQP